MRDIIVIHPDDSVAIALRPIHKGETISVRDRELVILEDIAPGHKIALCSIEKGSNVLKYGYPIGRAKEMIPAGAWVHTHNLQTNLNQKLDYTYAPVLPEQRREEAEYFLGYRRNDGKVGVRNEIWIIPTVGCVNSIAQQIEQKSRPLITGTVENVCAFQHPYGCSQLSEDHAMTQEALAGLAKHPNAGGVLILGLGCENNNIQEFRAVLGEYDPERIRFLNCQDYPDEVDQGVECIRELIAYAGTCKREPCPAQELILGLKCGGSDGFSGITANPLVGAAADLLTAQGGTAVLTEVPEMFGAETILMNRCQSQEVFEKTVSLINDFKDYFTRHGQVVYENPSPGNKAGGISTLEDKSLGCIQKGGRGSVVDVLKYGEPVRIRGLNLLQAPGNDLVAATALVVSGAQIVLFTTGRGTPFHSPVPTVKISSNSDLYHRKKNWIDFNAGALLENGSMENMSRDFFRYILEVASGRQTLGEQHGFRDIAIFKDGVTL